MFKTSSLIRFSSIAVLVLFAAQKSAVAESWFEFYPRTITVYHKTGSAEFKARIWVTPRIDGTPDRPAIALSINRLELVRINPGGLARVTWEFDLSDCDMRKQFTVEVELTGSNGNRTEEVDQNGCFTWYVGDVISAVNVDYKWLENEASWQFTHGRRMPDGLAIPYIPPRSSSAPDSLWTQDPQTYAEGLRAEARRLREFADQIAAAAAAVAPEIERLQAERNAEYQLFLDARSAGDMEKADELLQSTRGMSAKLVEAVELRREAEERVGRLRKQAGDLEHDAQAALSAADDG